MLCQHEAKDDDPARTAGPAGGLTRGLVALEAGHERVRRGNLVRRIETLPENARRHFALS